MTNQLSSRDFELLSCYLDEQLSDHERNLLESRLQKESELQITLDEMRRTQAILRATPPLRAPRNYTLKPEMVGIHRPQPRYYPVLKLASALASLLFVMAFIGDLIASNAQVQAPVALVQEAALLTEAAVEGVMGTNQGLAQSKAPPAPAPESAQEPLPVQAATETAMQPMLAMEMVAATPEETQADFRQGQESEDALHEPIETPVQQPAIGPDLENQREIKPAVNPGWSSPLRIIEILALVFALVTGLAAIYIRRKG